MPEQLKLGNRFLGQPEYSDSASDGEKPDRNDSEEQKRADPSGDDNDSAAAADEERRGLRCLCTRRACKAAAVKLQVRLAASRGLLAWKLMRYERQGLQLDGV